MRLTPRQEQIIKLVAAGLGDKEIAARLGLAPNTVRTHLQRLFRQHGLRNRAEAAAEWVTLRQAAPTRVHDRTEPDEGRVIVKTRPAGRRWFSLSLPAVALLGMALAAIPSSNPAITNLISAPTISRPSQAAQIRLATEELNLVNSDRASDGVTGLSPLSWNGCLASIASQEAKRLVAPGDLSKRIVAALDRGCGLRSLKTAESVGYWSSINDGQLNAIFMADPQCRANILGPYQYLGAAWATAPTGVAYLVVEFG
jgi:DNA-binding CsgD family transcriptional regulator/uncharacterized protein YkwD